MYTHGKEKNWISCSGSDGNDDFFDAVGKIETPRAQKTSNNSTSSPETEFSSETTPESNHVIRFNTRIFSFPDTPPKTPTKRSKGHELADLQLKSLQFSNERVGLGISFGVEVDTTGPPAFPLDLTDSTGVLKYDTKRLATIFAPTTPEHLENSRPGFIQQKLFLTPPETPFKTSNAKDFENGRTLGSDSVVDNLSEHGETTPLHFSNKVTQLPLTPPKTPTDDPRFSGFHNETLFNPFDDIPVPNISDEISINDNDAKPTYYLSEPLISSILISLNSLKPSCSGCATFSIDVALFNTISAALANHVPTSTHPFHIHPGLISQIIALIPTSSSSTPISSNTQTRFFATFKTTPKNPTYREVHFQTLLNYQSFRRQEFQIEGSSACGKHGNGFMVWRFSYKEELCESRGRGDRVGVLSLREMARYKRGFLERKLAYYSR